MAAPASRDARLWVETSDVCDVHFFHRQLPGGLDRAVLGLEAFVLRFFGEKGEDRLLIVNLGADLPLDPAPKPVLAPPGNKRWEILWSSEHPSYGGSGTPPLESEDSWRIPGETAVVLHPKPAEETQHA
jgi:maltooligosyltrehalose trehalohydrolase